MAVDWDGASVYTVKLVPTRVKYRYRCSECQAIFRAQRKRCSACARIREWPNRDRCVDCSALLFDAERQKCPVCGGWDVERLDEVGPA